MSINKVSKGRIGAASLALKGGDLRITRIPVTTLSASEVNTGVQLPAGAVVRHVALDTTTVEATAATKTISVGTLSSESGGNASGFLTGVSTASAAVIGPSLAGTPTRGALLRESASATSGGTVPVPVDAIMTTARTISYTLASVHTELKADIVLTYLVL